MFSKEYADTVCTRIAAPGAQENQPYMEFSAIQHTGLIYIGKHYADIDNRKERRHHLIGVVFRISKYVYCHQKHEIQDQREHLVHRVMKQQRQIENHNARIARNFQQIPFIFSYLHHAEQLSCADQRQAQNRHIEHGSAAADRKQRHKDEHDAA